MATAADVKAANGLSGRPGRIPRNLVEEWNRDHPDDPFGTPPRTGQPDYPDGDFESAFADDSADGAQPDAEEPADAGETRPQRPSARRGKGKAGAFRNPFSRKPQTGKQNRKKPRISTEELLGSLWRGAAKLAAPLPPLQRTLRVQAPVAGALLEDAVRDTFADAILQPFARAAGAGKAVSALAGPPVLVTSGSMYMLRCEQMGIQPNPVVIGVLNEALRTSLMAWMDIAGPKFEEAMRHEQEFEAKYGKSVDEMIAWLFSARVNPEDEEAVAAEEDAIRRAQGIL